MTPADVIARLREIEPMHGGACMNEIRTLRMQIEAEELHPAVPVEAPPPPPPPPPPDLDHGDAGAVEHAA
jgi:hypothetical protein